MVPILISILHISCIFSYFHLLLLISTCYVFIYAYFYGNGGPMGLMRPMGTHWAHWDPWAHGDPLGPWGTLGLWGPMGPWGPIGTQGNA